MVDVRAFGAVGDGVTRDTLPIQRAIAACAAAGGGAVHVPAGVYVTGSLFLLDRVTLQVEAGATLLGSEDPADYPIITSRWEGAEQATHAPLIGGVGLHGAAVIGRGVIDGRGAGWWQRFRAGDLPYPRPRLLAFTECRDLLIEGLTLTRSPAWTVNPVRCDNVTIEKLTIVNPPDSPNTDGVNPDSCRNVRIANCHIDMGDDCIAIKSGTEAGDPRLRAPCENIAITNCTMLHGHGGVVIGSEMSGDVRRVVIGNCIFQGTDRGIRLKSRRGRGGVVEDVRVANVVMDDVLCPVTVNLFYACGAWGDKTVSDKQCRPVTDATPRFRRIHLSHITATRARLAAGFIYGLPELPVEDLSFDDVMVIMAQDAAPGYPEMADDMETMQAAGLFARNVKRLRLRDVQVTGQRGPALRLENVEVES